MWRVHQLRCIARIDSIASNRNSPDAAFDARGVCSMDRPEAERELGMRVWWWSVPVAVFGNTFGTACDMRTHFALPLWRL